MDATGFEFAGANKPHTVLVVFKNSVGIGTGNMLGCKQTPAGYGIGSNAFEFASFGAGTQTNGLSLSADTPYIGTLSGSAAIAGSVTLDLWINGVQGSPAIQQTGVATCTSMNIGNHAGVQFFGHIAEILMYGKQLERTEREEAEAFLAERFDITL